MAKATNKEKNPVEELFSAIGIKRVVYVDDRFGVTRERIADVCRQLSADQIATSAVFPDLDLTDDEAVRATRLQRAIEALPDNKLTSAFDALGNVREPVPEGADKDQDRNAATAFSTLLQGTSELVCLSRAQWKDRQAALIGEIAQTPTLFIFDDDFRLEGLGQDEGRRLIAELHAAAQGYRYAYALLTHNAQDEAGEQQIEHDLSQQNAALSNFVVVIAKARLSGDRQRFVQRLKSTLLFRLFRSVMAKLKSATEEACTKAMTEINAMKVEEFERIIFSSSQREGAWSPETLVRIIAVIQERHVRSSLRGDEQIHAIVADIDPLCGVSVGIVPASVAETARRLQRLEIYDSHEGLNDLHLPLEVGDIFEDPHTMQQYILLAQPCDLMVRAKGLRKGTRDPRQMAPLAAVSKHTGKAGETPTFRAFEHELPHFCDSALDYCCVALNEVCHVPIWLLDLAVFNADGNCRISKGQATPAVLTAPWRKRLSILIERGEDVVTTIDGIPSLDDQTRASTLQALLRLPLGTPVIATIGPEGRKPGENWVLSAGFKRVGRLRERHATAMLTQYGSYTTRLAHPHDLTNF